MRVGAMRGRNTIWNRFGWALFTAVAATVLVRAAVVASHTEGGWEILGDHLRAGLPRALRGTKSDFDDYGLRKSQWLWEQADRIEADPNSTAADFMGAALTFVQFFNRSMVAVNALGAILWREESSAAGDQSVASAQWTISYEDWMRRSHELAVRATKLEPDEPEWWRLRAVLVSDRRTTRSNWDIDFELLEEGPKHDPNNALYDYLAGSHFWDQSVMHGFRGLSGFDIDSYQDALSIQRGRQAWTKSIRASAAAGFPAIVDPERRMSPIVHPDYYQAAMQHYRQAFGKHFLATGAKGSAAVLQFLDHCPAPIAVKLQYLEPMKFNVLRSPIYQIAEGPIREAIAAHLDDRDLVGASHLLEHAELRFIDQAEAAGEPIGQFRANIFDPQQKAELASTINRRPLDDPLALRFDELLHAVNPTPREHLILTGTKAWGAASTAEEQRWESSKIWSYLGVTTGAIAWLLLALGASVTAVAWLLGRGNRQTAGSLPLWMSTTVWIGVLAVIFALFGLIPAFEPELEHYHWSVAALLAGFLAVLSGYIAWRIGRYVVQQGTLLPNERSAKYHLARITLVAGSSLLFIVPLLAATDVQFRTAIYDVARHFPNDLGISKRSISGSFPFSASSLIGAILQFGVHRGLFIVAGVGITLLVIGNWRRSIRRRGEEATQPATCIGIRLLSILRAASIATVFFATLMLLVSLATTTQWIESLRSQYELQRSRIADPGWYEKEVLEALELSKGH
jgi:hypothetical protein